MQIISVTITYIIQSKALICILLLLSCHLLFHTIVIKVSPR
jgi:hypothetical protein